MKIHYTPKKARKYPSKKLYCVNCDKLANMEDIKFGCIRCEYRSMGRDVPEGWTKKYDAGFVEKMEVES